MGRGLTWQGDTKRETPRLERQPREVEKRKSERKKHGPSPTTPISTKLSARSGKVNRRATFFFRLASVPPWRHREALPSLSLPATGRELTLQRQRAVTTGVAWPLEVRAWGDDDEGRAAVERGGGEKTKTVAGDRRRFSTPPSKNDVEKNDAVGAQLCCARANSINSMLA